MPSRLKPEQQKKPHPFSIENPIYDEFALNCANIDSTVSREIRKFIMLFNKKCDKKEKRDDTKKEV